MYVRRAGLLKFFEFVSGTERTGAKVTKNEFLYLEKIAKKYMESESDYIEDLMKFASSLNKIPPLTVKSYIASVKEYFGYNEVELTQRQIKMVRLKLPKGGVRTIEKDMTVETINKILAHLDIKGTAFVLVSGSSGMRINETLSITLDDIDLKSEPVMITIRGEYTKTGEQRFTFISREAKEALIEWLKVREKYIGAAQNKNKGLIASGSDAKPKDLKDNRIFPFCDTTAQQIWHNGMKNAGLFSVDRGTNRGQLRIHALRKFFRSQLALGCPVDIVEALMGHEGYLTGAYRRYTKAQMAEYYLKNEHFVTVVGNQSVEEIKKEITGEMNEAIEKLTEENKILRKDVESLQSQNAMLDHENTQADSARNDYNNQIDDLQKQMDSMQKSMQKLITSMPHDIANNLYLEIKDIDTKSYKQPQKDYVIADKNEQERLERGYIEIRQAEYKKKHESKN